MREPRDLVFELQPRRTLLRCDLQLALLVLADVYNDDLPAELIKDGVLRVVDRLGQLLDSLLGRIIRSLSLPRVG